jgi:glycosyltransferase involved in cell wall biosynthesis
MNPPHRHLAIFLPSLGGGGAEKVMLALAGEFTRMGVNCDIVIAMREGQLLSSVPQGVRLVSLDKKKTLSATGALARYLRKERPDVLLATVFTASITALLASRFAPATRTVLREASLPSIDVVTKSWLGTQLNRMAARLLYRFADASIALAERLRLDILEMGLLPEEKIHVIPNPLAAIHEPIRPTKSQVRQIVACGRLEKQKDVATLIAAFGLLRESCPAHLTILGDGSLKASLEQQAKDLGLSEHITFAGYVKDPSQYFRRSDVFVHTAIYEGFSNVVLEALGCGCSVVATDCPSGVREALDNGRYGVLVPMKDPGAVAHAVAAILHGDLTFPCPKAHLRSFEVAIIARRYVSVLFPNRTR